MSGFFKRELITVGAVAVLLTLFALLPTEGALRVILLLIPFLGAVAEVALRLYKKLSTKNILNEYTAVTLSAVLAFIGGACVQATVVILIFRLASLFITFASSKAVVSKTRNIPSATERKATKLPLFFMLAFSVLSLIVFIIKLIIDVSAWQEALYTAAVILALSYPCAIVVTTPAAFLSGIKKLEKNGVVLGGHYVIERMARCTSVIFEKTGILSTPFTKVDAANPELMGEEQLLNLIQIALADSNDENAADFKKANPYFGSVKADRTEVLPGLGTVALISGKVVSIGSGELMEKLAVEGFEATSKGEVLHVALGRTYLGYIFSDENINEDAEKSLYRLKARGVRHIAMLSEDPMSRTAKVAETLHAIDDYYPNLTPDKKADTVEKLIAANSVGTTALVGNADSLRLNSDINFVLSDTICDGADTVITNGDVDNVPLSLKTADAVILAVKENIIASLAIKLVLTILALTGITGIFVTVLADTVVTVLTMLNSLRLMLD
ncbi:MAG: hypothetical protein E7613_06470 [Ruminococcaceae bacterium]|nr:hypothetical protein [Oscillospiraceae bacterium]